MKVKKLGIIVASVACAAALAVGLTACGGSSSSSSSSSAAAGEDKIAQELKTQIGNLTTKSYSAVDYWTDSTIPNCVFSETIGYDADLQMYYEDCTSLAVEYTGDVAQTAKDAVNNYVNAYKQIGKVFYPTKEEAVYVQVNDKTGKITDVKNVTEKVRAGVAARLSKVIPTDAGYSAVQVDKNATVNGEKCIVVSIAASTYDKSAGIAGAVSFVMDPNSYELKAIATGDVAAAKYKVTTTTVTKTSSTSSTSASTSTSTSTSTVAAGAAEADLYVFTWGQGSGVNKDTFSKADATVDVSDALKELQAKYAAASNPR